MNAFLETKSCIITTAHTVMAATLQENHDAVPLHKHHFISAVSNGIDEMLKNFEHIEITENEVIAMVENSFDIARIVADTGGLVYTRV